MAGILVSKTLPAVIDVQRVARNGLIPAASTISKVASGLNHAVLYRRKLFGSYPGRRDDQTALIFPDTTSTGPTSKWRWRNHTGLGGKSLRFVVQLALARGGNDCRVRFAVTEAGGATVDTG